MSAHRSTWATIACGVLAVASGVAQRTAPEPRAFFVDCRDGVGQPVAGAEVHVFQRTALPDGRIDYRGSGPRTTDAAGRAVFDDAATFDGDRYDRWVYARVPGRLVGGQRSTGSESADREPIRIEVRLVPSRDLPGTVRVPDGFDVAAVRVRVLGIDVLDDSPLGVPLLRSPGVPGPDAALPERFESAVDAGGRFVLHDVPVSSRVYLTAQGEGLATARYTNAGDGPEPLPAHVDFAMVEETMLHGRLSGPDGAPLAGVVVRARITDAGFADASAAVDAVTAADGTWRIRGMPSTGCDVTVDTRDLPMVHRPTRVSLGPPGTETELPIELEAGIQVSGRFVDASTRQPVAGVTIQAITTDEDPTLLATMATGSIGRFAFELPSGSVRLVVASVPRDYRMPNPRTVATIAVAADDPMLGTLQFTLRRRSR